MIYRVIICPDKYCRGVSIIKEPGQTVKCRSCGSQYKFRKYRVSYKTSNKDEAIEARTKLLMKINDDDRTYEDLEEEGLLNNPDSLLFDKNDTDDTRSPKKIIRDCVRDIDEPTREEIIEEATSNGMDKEKAEKIVNRLLQKGRAIQVNGSIELL